MRRFSVGRVALLRLALALALLPAIVHDRPASGRLADDEGVQVLARGVTAVYGDATVWRGRTAVVVSRRLRSGVSLDLCTTAGCERLGRSSREIREVEVATAGNRPIVAWTQPGSGEDALDVMLWDGERRRIFAGVRTAGVAGLAVAANASGDAAVAWRSDDEMLVVRRDRSGQLGSAELLVDDPGQSDPVLAVSAAGDVLAAWETRVGFSTRYAPRGEAFSPPRATAQRLEVHDGPTRYEDPGDSFAAVRRLEAMFVGAQRALVVAQVVEVPGHEEDCADEGSIEGALVTAGGAPDRTTLLSGARFATGFVLAARKDQPWVAWTESKWLKDDCEKAVRLHWRRWRGTEFSPPRSCRLPKTLRTSLEIHTALGRTGGRAWVFLGRLRDLGVYRRTVIGSDGCRFGTRRFEIFGLRDAGGGVDYLSTRPSSKRGFDVVVLK